MFIIIIHALLIVVGNGNSNFITVFIYLFTTLFFAVNLFSGRHQFEFTAIIIDNVSKSVFLPNYFYIRFVILKNKSYFYCCFIITSINQSIFCHSIQFNSVFNSLIFVFDFILRKKKYCHFDYLTTIIIWTTNIFIFLGSIFLFVVIDFDLFIHIPQLVSIHIYQPYQTKKKNSFMNCLSVVIFSYIFILNFDFFIFASSFTIFHPIPIVRLSYTKKMSHYGLILCSFFFILFHIASLFLFSIE